MDDNLLDAICGRLVSSLSTQGTYIVCEDDPVNEMLFIIRGQLESSTTDGERSGFFNSITLRPGNFCGEELPRWALSPNATSYPCSTRSIRTLTEVEGFALRAKDLIFVANQFKYLHSKKLQHAFKYYSHQWQTWGDGKLVYESESGDSLPSSDGPNVGQQVILEAHGLWEAIEPKENMKVDDKKNKATMAFLYQALTKDVILQVAGCKTANELWESLKKRHVGEEKVQQARLQSLMIRFIQIVASIEQTNDLDDITLDEIVGKLKAFEERIKLRKEGQVESQENLLFAHGEHSRKGRRFIKRGDASIWYLDNGTSNHMMGTKSHFRDIDESVTGRVRFGDVSYVQIKGRGSILLGKYSRTPFLNQAKFRSKNPLDLVYGDLCGPISPATHSGKKLIFLLVDDCTRFMWAYFLTSKDQAFSTFKEFRQQIEMEMRMKLRMLRTYRGGEFTSKEFTKYCKENGIARHLTAPYSPQQNRVVERRNITVLSTTRSMMKAMKLPITFWVEAVKHAIYILNRVPTRALVDKTPYEALYNRKPNMENLRIFGCTAYAKVTIPHLKKLDDRSIPMVYLGLRGRIKSIDNSLDISTSSISWMASTSLRCKISILHGDLKEEVYVTQPEGFIQQGNSGKVYKLTKALYGLRQAPQAWNVKLDQTLMSLDFKKCNLKQAVYTKRSKTSTLIVEVYVDDLLITGTPRKEIDLFKSQIEDKFEMNDLGLLAYYLGIEVTRIEVTQIGRVITIRQTGYINKILKETSMMESNDTKIPMDPGTKFMQDPKDHHLKAVKRVIQNIKGTKEHGIIYKKEGGCKITESPITWCTQKQPTVALSSCESEFMAATGAACQALWLKRLLSEITGWEEERITLKIDNISAIALVRNSVFHRRSKHIDIRYHFIRECIENGHINMEHISGELQRAYILTKALPRLKFVTLRQIFGVQDLGRSNDRD
uniref:Zinc finger, CCHC-type n=1 Tax=Tanacetum cinerariifolium TaxID=118510 RepID=A0A6L2KBB1_TANCI|nr:zinc finger, CCHC-type [Tanacetum cinerariifolium]